MASPSLTTPTGCTQADVGVDSDLPLKMLCGSLQHGGCRRRRGSVACEVRLSPEEVTLEGQT